MYRIGVFTDVHGNDLALKTVESTLLHNNISLDKISLSVASKDELSNIVNLENIKSIVTP